MLRIFFLKARPERRRRLPQAGVGGQQIAATVDDLNVSVNMSLK